MFPEIGISLFNNNNNIKKSYRSSSTSFKVIIENISSKLGSRLANCGNTLELRVLTQLHHENIIINTLQDIYVSKWSTMAAKDKQARQEQDKNWFRQRKPNGNENEWGPMFKNKAHFSDMHLC
ncbi:hypothetical protein DERF_014692 [Dermatophagoides farinae]|uniref:Uncharacterized protein n=1 Tax=Dermatophagoides farinae TaxID=6954 RepID=A0A922HJ53_DERFA|nr:hypothetical protein DERF_014692 [Dermatophagoides farinae]